jgi:hypothetical protein
MAQRVACTIITKNYLAYARTLAKTLIEQNPEATLYVLLADRLEDYFRPEDEPFELIRLEDLPDQDAIEKMCFYYTPLELCCALRGLLHDYIIQHTTAESWIFLDCDIMVCGCLESVFQALSDTSILFTPHCSVPMPIENAEQEMSVLMHGLSNAGFLGLRRTEQTQKFLSWWKERLQYYCFLDSAIGDPRGLSVDQLWLNLALLYFPDFKFFKHPGANIGHWNFYEREFEFDAQGNIIVNQQSVLFLHFSGWNINTPEIVSKHSPLYRDKITSPWVNFAKKYRELLLENGYEETKEFPYAFGQFEEAIPITQAMRRGYYNELKQGIAVEFPFKKSEYFQSKRFPLDSTHFLREELHDVYHQLVELQQQNHQLHLTLEQTHFSLHETHTKLQGTETEFAQFQQQAEAEIARSHQTIAEMENSIFWKIRNKWWKIKQRFGQAEVNLLKKK